MNKPGFMARNSRVDTISNDQGINFACQDIVIEKSVLNEMQLHTLDIYEGKRV